MYRIVERRLWSGCDYRQLHREILAPAVHWQAWYIVVDAAGLDAGLSNFLSRTLPGRVIPFCNES